MCDNLLAWAVSSAHLGKARVLTGSLHALNTPFNIRVRRIKAEAEAEATTIVHEGPHGPPTPSSTHMTDAV